MKNTQFRSSFWKSKKIAKSFFGAILGVFIFGIVNTYAFPIYSIFASVPLSITGPTSYYTQATTAWTSTGILASGGLGGYVYTLPVAPGGATVNPSTGVVSFTPASAGQYSFTVRVTDAGSSTADLSFTLDVYATGVCVWIGTTNTSWTTASNWTYCGGSAPTSTSDVAIASQAVNMPVVAANTTINSFGLGPGGGTVTINATVTLTITATTNSIRSSVGFQGGVSTCTTCVVVAPGNIQIVDGASLTLIKGILLSPQVSNGIGSINVGNGTTGGRLATGPTASLSEYPRIVNSFGGGSAGAQVVVNGVSGQPGQVSIDGLTLSGWPNSANNFSFQGYFEIQKMDKLDLYQPSGVIGGQNYFLFSNCTNGSVTDTNWTDLQFNDSLASSSYNVNASGTNCSGLPVITISNISGTTGGSAYGSLYENDPNSKINWANGNSLTCTWTGATNTAWTNPSNWSSCINGRGNYPDQLDEVIIPVTANQPVISSSTSIRRFAPSGSGGGTVTLNASVTLSVTATTQSVRSDVKLQGASATCSNCFLRSPGNLAITDGATLTLIKGISIYLQAPNAMATLNVGDGTTGGRLATGPTAAANEYPLLYNNFAGGSAGVRVFVNGVSGQPGRLNIDGFNMSNSPSSSNNFIFQGYYDIEKMDKLSLNNPSANISSGYSYILFSTCTNGTVTDTTWSDIEFKDSVAAFSYNINASGLNCSALPTITVNNISGTTGGPAYGPIYELDANNKINWSNGTSMTCTWTGATSTSWATPTNWSGCTNSRANYPDQLDEVIIPAAPLNQPTVAANTTIQRFALSGSGGGTITVNASTALTVTSTTDTVRSNIRIQGATSTCTSCGVRLMSSSAIVDNATLTLLRGISVSLISFNAIGILKVGDGTTAGHLATGTAGAWNEYPLVSNSLGGGSAAARVILEGPAAAASSIDVDGLKFDSRVNNQSGLYFQGYYRIKKMNRLTFNYAISGSSFSYVRFNSCTNAEISDNTWSFFDFTPAISGGAYNIRADGTNCSTLPVINMYQATGAGAGATYENDPNSKINWTNVFLTGSPGYDATVGTNWTQTFTASGGTPAYTYSFQVSPGSATINSSTGQVDFNPASAGTYNFTVRATESGPGTYMDFSFVVHAYNAGVCLWNGSTSTTWGTAANWSFCGGVAPTSTSDVAISAFAPNMPILLANTTVNSFGLGPGGGTITVGSGITLTIAAVTNTFRSSIKLQGSTTTCTNCVVTKSGASNIVDGAILTLLKGIAVTFGGTLSVGDGVTGGTLATGPAGASNEYPTIYSSNMPVNVIGASGKRGVLNLDGIRFSNFWYNNSPVTLSDWYEIQKLDNIVFSSNWNPSDTSAIRLTSCTNGLVTDATWSGLTFVNSFNTSKFNIDASGTNCSTLPAISVTSAGSAGNMGYGSIFENDPNNKISWSNDTSFNCTWTGSSDSSWVNPSNWSGCSNSRGNYPDQTDTVVIPVTATQPVVAANAAIKGFGSGTGGGTITINTGRTLSVSATTNTFLSSVAVQGATTTCTNCAFVSSGAVGISGNSTLTLLKGISVTFAGQISLGNGVTGGTLATGPAGTTSEYPSVSAGWYGAIVLNGASGNLSSLNLDGIKFNTIAYHHAIQLTDWYDIQKFDNVIMTSNWNPGGRSAVRFNSCTNATLTDTTWSSLTFTNTFSATYSNIDASGTNCSTLPAISVTSAGSSGNMGYGSIFENDPNNKIGWSNDTSFNCTWTGSADSSWVNPSNWSGCSNSRGNYPDQTDTVVIPVTATQPVVAANAAIKGFGSGTGGGTITINAGRTLIVAGQVNAPVLSDIQLTGATTTCTNCSVVSTGSILVTSGSKITMLKGISLAPNGQLSLGNGVTGGHLATGSAGTLAEYPVYSGWQSSIVLGGASGNRSSLNFDGIKIVGFAYSTMLVFSDWYEIKKFDQVKMTSNFDPSGVSAIQFSNCTNALMTDTNWASPEFTRAFSVSRYNINASGTSCSTLPTISVTGATGSGACGNVGSGACTLENDPNSKIDWN